MDWFSILLGITCVKTGNYATAFLWLKLMWETAFLTETTINISNICASSLLSDYLLPVCLLWYWHIQKDNPSSHFRHLQVMMNKFNATPLKIYSSIKPVCVIVNPCVKHEPSECIRIWSHAQRHWSAPKCVNLRFSVKTYIQLNETVLKYMHVSCANTPTNTSSFSFLSFFHSLIKKRNLLEFHLHCLSLSLSLSLFSASVGFAQI